MLFSTDATPAELPAFLTRFVTIVGARSLKARLKVVQDQARTPAGADYIRDRFKLEWALSDILKYRDSTRRVPWPPRDPSEYRLYSFMAIVARVYHYLSPAGKKNLEGALIKSLDQEHGFAPLAFEMNVAAHFMSAGFDVDFTDTEGRGRFDFLASKDTDVIEVECKFVSPDIGRKIHKRKFCAFADYLKPLLDEAGRNHNGGLFIRIELPDRLTGKIEEAQSIEAVLAQALQSRKESSSEYASVNVQPFELSESPFTEEKSSEEMVQDMRGFIESRFGMSNPHAMVSGIRGQSAIVVSAVSQKPDAVVKEIYKKHLREAAGQLTGTRMGGIFLFFPNLKEGQLREVAGKETELTNAVKVILQKRQHLYGVALMASGVVTERKSDLIIAPTITSESGPVCTFRNPFYSLVPPVDDTFKRIFSSTD